MDINVIEKAIVELKTFSWSEHIYTTNTRSQYSAYFDCMVAADGTPWIRLDRAFDSRPSRPIIRNDGFIKPFARNYSLCDQDNVKNFPLSLMKIMSHDEFYEYIQHHAWLDGYCGSFNSEEDYIRQQEEEEYLSQFQEYSQLN